MKIPLLMSWVFIFNRVNFGGTCYKLERRQLLGLLRILRCILWHECSICLINCNPEKTKLRRVVKGKTIERLRPRIRKKRERSEEKRHDGGDGCHFFPPKCCKLMQSLEWVSLYRAERNWSSLKCLVIKLPEGLLSLNLWVLFPDCVWKEFNAMQ